MGAPGDSLRKSVLLGARNVCLNYLEYENHNFTCIHAVHLSGPMYINKCVFFFDFIDCLTMFVTILYICVLVNSDALNGLGVINL